MQRAHLLPLLLPALVLAACEQEQPTAPTTQRAGPAFAAAGQRVVNSSADPGNGVCDASECTLREAINDPAATEITFASGVTGPIVLARPAAGGGTLDIDRSLSITGPSGSIVIRRNTSDPDFRIFRVVSGATVELANLTIQQGRTSGPTGGAAIVSYGNLTLTTCTASHNTTLDGGGTISNRGGTLRLQNTTVSDNTGAGVDNHNGKLTAGAAIVRNSGAGIQSTGGTVALKGVRIANNAGGGISAFEASVTLFQASVVGNSSAEAGGGIALAFGDLLLSHSVVLRNSAAEGGGIANRSGGDMTIEKSTIADNSASGPGGGIANDANRRADALLRITNSTISNNSAERGAGIYNIGFVAEARVTLTNTTIAHNGASGAGGGIRQESDEGLLDLRNTLIALNTGASGPDVSNSNQGSSVFARFSLIGNGSGSGISSSNGNLVGTSGSPIDPKLGPLAQNGERTPTHALLAGSPAIDAAGSQDCPATDQRGVIRPQGAGCDIGSYERK